MRARVPTDDLIDLSVRLPRRLVEQAVLDAHCDMPGSTHRRIALAKAILAGRRRRRVLLPGIRLGEASWDMLLDLYVAAYDGGRVDVSGLCIASGASPTTALRHLQRLVDAGAVHRLPDPHDRRRTWTVIDPALTRSLDRWLDLQLAALEACIPTESPRVEESRPWQAIG
jgi:DNA-binding MarR family transcriptional regulator